jgi:hypothetical protein
MENTNLTKTHLLTHEVDVNLDVLHSAMLNGIISHVNRTDIVTEDNGRTRKRMMKLL